MSFIRPPIERALLQSGGALLSGVTNAIRPCIGSLLTPKSEVVWVDASGTIEQAMERMRPNGYCDVPVLNDEGCYVGTLGTSDLLWYLSDGALTGSLMLVPRRSRASAVHVQTSVATLIGRALNQNFVAVVDDDAKFLGIVRRRSILEYCIVAAPELLAR